MKKNDKLFEVKRQKQEELINEEMAGFMSGAGMDNLWFDGLDKEYDAFNKKGGEAEVEDITVEPISATEAGMESEECCDKSEECQILEDCRFALIELSKQYNMESSYVEGLLNCLNRLELKINGIQGTTPAPSPAMAVSTPQQVSSKRRKGKVVTESKKTIGENRLTNDSSVNGGYNWPISKIVQNSILKAKKMLMKKAGSKGVYENFGQKEVRQLEDKFAKLMYGTPEERKAFGMIQDFADWCSQYNG